MSILMFETSWCPYCKQAHGFMNELKQEYPKYNELDIKIIDEEKYPDISNKYDYFYVPTFYIGEEKLHEGIPSKKIIQKIFEKAYISN